MRAARMVPSLLAVVALGAAGCTQPAADSAGDFEGREKQVAEAIDDVVEAAKRGDAKKICDSYLTPALQKRMAAYAGRSRRGTGCEAALEDSLRDANGYDIDVKAIRISGNRATAEVETRTGADDDPVDRVVLVEARGWRLDELP